SSATVSCVSIRFGTRYAAIHASIRSSLRSRRSKPSLSKLRGETRIGLTTRTFCVRHRRVFSRLLGSPLLEFLKGERARYVRATKTRSATRDRAPPLNRRGGLFQAIGQ